MRDQRDPLLRYCEAFSSPPSDLLNRLERETHLKTLAPQMLSGPFQGQFLRFFSLLLRPAAILEIGTFTGYGTLCLAAGLQENGILHTIEANEELAYFGKKYFAEAGFADRIHAHLGDAKRIIPTLPGPFDLVFIDAGKLDYAAYYDLVMPKLRSGGYILADNVLWSGKILDVEKDADTQHLHDFNRMIQADPRVENLILPLRDGLLIARKN